VWIPTFGTPLFALPEALEVVVPRRWKREGTFGGVGDMDVAE
jgi:hypothetical protein